MSSKHFATPDAITQRHMHAVTLVLGDCLSQIYATRAAGNHPQRWQDQAYGILRYLDAAPDPLPAIAAEVRRRHRTALYE